MTRHASTLITMTILASALGCAPAAQVPSNEPTASPTAAEPVDPATAKPTGPNPASTDDGDTEIVSEASEEDLPRAELPAPTDEELAAWNRKDPEHEKHLYKWDKAHAAVMQGYWQDLMCFRSAMKQAGEGVMAPSAGEAEEERWQDFKRVFIPKLDAWMQELFAEQGTNILTKSKYVTYILEAHEIVMNFYPVGYNERDEVEVMRADAFWTMTENKMSDYSDRISAPLALPDLDDPQQLQKWEASCRALVSPTTN